MPVAAIMRSYLAGTSPASATACGSAASAESSSRTDPDRVRARPSFKSALFLFQRIRGAMRKFFAYHLACEGKVVAVDQTFGADKAEQAPLQACKKHISGPARKWFSLLEHGQPRVALNQASEQRNPRLHIAYLLIEMTF